MDDARRADLLRPTLDPSAPGQQMPYSPTSYFWVAFLGGPLAIGSWFAVNSRRLGRLRQDQVAIALFIIVGLAWPVLSGALPVLFPDELGWLQTNRTLRLVTRGFGLVLWGVARYLHRVPLKAATLSDQPFESPWRTGTAVVFVSALIVIPLAIVARGLLAGGLQ